MDLYIYDTVVNPRMAAERVGRLLQVQPFYSGGWRALTYRQRVILLNANRKYRNQVLSPVSTVSTVMRWLSGADSIYINEVCVSTKKLVKVFDSHRKCASSFFSFCLLCHFRFTLYWWEHM